MRLNDLLKKEKTNIHIATISHIYENTLGLSVGCTVDTVPYDAKILEESNLQQGSKVIIYVDERGIPIQAFSPDGKMFYNKE